MHSISSRRISFLLMSVEYTCCYAIMLLRYYGIQRKGDFAKLPHVEKRLKQNEYVLSSELVVKV